jgi:signal transduction histidine kinase
MSELRRELQVDADTAFSRRIFGVFPTFSDPDSNNSHPPIFDRSSFHNELRNANVQLLFWTVLIFNPVYLAWTVFDYLLAPEYWRFFLVLRLSVFLINTVVMIAVVFLGLRRYSWEGFWMVVSVYAIFVAPMLPLVGSENLTRYIMGYSMVIFGAGLIPIWKPRWLMSCLAVSLISTVLVFRLSVSVSSASIGDLVASIFVVVTAAGFAVVGSVFKYDVAKRDYLSRLNLSAVAERETEARMRLADTSRDLEEALRRLKELDRLKSRFFANISHELRTPLTLILAPIDELSSTVKSDHDAQQLRVIRRNAERLLRLINDLLDLSKLDAGGLRLNLAEMDVRSVVTAVRENSLPAAHAKGIDFVLKMDQSSRLIQGDAHRLEIVFTNLVSNAIKFTPENGRVEVNVNDCANVVAIEVIDNGPGIPSEDLSRVFERFFQVGDTGRRRGEGVGIGLALAKELVDLHGGKISVESTEGEFTRFLVVLPFGSGHIRPEVIERRRQFEKSTLDGRREEDKGSQLEPLVSEEIDQVRLNSPNLKPEVHFDLGDVRPRILLVEDNDDVREFIGSLLADQCDLELAVDGADAINLLKKGPPDLVVSDVMMPRVSGTELCGFIKRDPVLHTVPVILLTARVGSEATLEAYAHGADDFVAKPFHPRVLLARIRAQLRLRRLGIRLVEQEKLAAVGTLAAGVLHEIRNPLNAILNASRVLTENELFRETGGELLPVICEAAKRIEGIASALDTHARPAEPGRPKPYDVRDGIDATLRLLEHRTRDTSIHREYQTDRLAVAAAGPLNQVFMNLLDNSLRAESRNIWISVELSGSMVRISVADDGPGIHPEDANRIFDPFFTKRKDKSGTGLGLYLSRKIVIEQGGALWHEQRPGGGALFVVEVPSIESV